MNLIYSIVTTTGQVFKSTEVDLTNAGKIAEKTASMFNYDVPSTVSPHLFSSVGHSTNLDMSIGNDTYIKSPNDLVLKDFMSESKEWFIVRILIFFNFTV